jgi:hypothetical protein
MAYMRNSRVREAVFVQRMYRYGATAAGGRWKLTEACVPVFTDAGLIERRCSHIILFT